MDEFLIYTFLGLSIACVYAIAASGLVLTYATSGVFNFAHGAIGMVAAFTYWQLHSAWGWPAVAALAVVLLVLAPGFGVLLQATVMRGLQDTSETIRVVVTIGVLASLVGAALWLWPPTQARPFPPFYEGSSVTLLGTVVTVHQLISIGCALAVAASLAWLLRTTRIGTSMRAVVDNPALLQLFGGRPDRVSALSWALGSALAGLAGILIAPTLQLSVTPLTLLVVDAYAAAVIGRLTNLRMTFVGAIVLGLAQAYGIGYLPTGLSGLSGIRPAVPVLILFLALLIVPRARLRGRAIVRSRDWLPAPSLRQVLLGGALFVGSAALIGRFLGTTTLFTAERTVALGIVALSLVPLVGYAGQLSLCQLSFAGIGALAMANSPNGGSPLGLALAFVAAAAVGALLALPLVRLSGIYLALATAAFAVVLDRWLFTFESVTVAGHRLQLFGFGSVAVPRLSFGPLSSTDDHSFLVLLSSVFALFGLLVVTIRRSAYGRVLIAMRESPVACASLGLSLTATRLSVFALSAGIAGVGGALLGGAYTAASPGHFSFFQNLPLLLLAVVGGVGSVGGITIGVLLLGLFTGLDQALPSLHNVFAVLPGLAGIGLARSPGGIAADLSAIWARRRGETAGEGIAAHAGARNVSSLDERARDREGASLDAALRLDRPP